MLDTGREKPLRRPPLVTAAALSLSMAALCVVADEVVFGTLSGRPMARAVCDSTTHGAVAAVAWAAVVSDTPHMLRCAQRLLRCLGAAPRQDALEKPKPATATATATATAPGAGAATAPWHPALCGQLPAPVAMPSPWMECVLAAAVASVMDADHFLEAASWKLSLATRLSRRPFAHSVVFCVAVVAAVGWWLRRRRLACIIAVAWGSHQLRDATRRGLCFWPLPLPDTSAVPYAVYVGTLAAWPCMLWAWRCRRSAPVPV